MKKFVPFWFDPVFTGILNQEKNLLVLENLLQVFLEEKNLKATLLSRNLENPSKTEHRKQMDILADIDGKKVNIELNSGSNRSVLNRNLVYACKIHGGQLQKGDSDYTEIKKTIQINFNMKIKNKEKMITKYQMTNEEGSILPNFEIYFVDIEKAFKKMYNKNEIEKANWAKLLGAKTMKEFEDILGEMKMDQETKDLLKEDIERYSEDEEVAVMYSDYTKQEMEFNTNIKEAKMQGFEEGKQEGKQEGIEKITKNLLMEQIDDDTILRVTRLTKEELQALKEKLF